MAVDSALKRSSADLVLMPFRGWVFPGTSGVSASERLAAGWMYSGISLAAAGDPSISKPAYLLFQDSIITEGTVGALADHEWDYGDNDSLGYDTIYIRDDSGDPDTTDVNINTVLEPTAFANYDNTFFVACDDGYIYKMDDAVEEDNTVEIPYVLGTKLFRTPFNEICLEEYNVSCGTPSSSVTLDLEIYASQTAIDSIHSSTVDVDYTINIGTEYDRNLNANYKEFMAILRNIDPDSQALRINNVVLITRASNK